MWQILFTRFLCFKKVVFVIHTDDICIYELENNKWAILQMHRMINNNTKMHCKKLYGDSEKQLQGESSAAKKMKQVVLFLRDLLSFLHIF